MKIIYVTARLPHGATEAFLIPEIRQLVAAGHDILVVPRSPRGPILHGEELLERASREPLWSRRVWAGAARVAIKMPRRTLAAARALETSRSLAMAAKNAAVLPKALWLAELATRWNASHIHSHWAGTTATMAWLASELTGVPWSFTAHRWDIVEDNLLSLKARSASFARFISEDGLRMARVRGVGPEANVKLLRMGVALPKVPAKRIRSSRVVLCPARLTEVKGHRFLLAAWRKLQDRGTAGELWLAGDGELRPELQALAQSLHLSDSVRFLGAVAHAKLLAMYAAGEVDVVVLASLELGWGNHEGIPVALVEAMSYAIPVVAAASGAIPELVLPGTGLLTPPGDVDAIANALALLMSDAALRTQLGDAGRRRAGEVHDVIGIVTELANAFAAARPRAAVAA
ncbi:MAG TPA: glycosyltransferase [Bryobacteraceae bacterium]|nr:glycosyltransferase [Bryobacteraceae bacterium]